MSTVSASEASKSEGSVGSSFMISGSHCCQAKGGRGAPGGPLHETESKTGVSVESPRV